jgi:hypothetical protein
MTRRPSPRFPPRANARELIIHVPLGQTVVVRFEPEPPTPVDAPNGDLGGQPQGRGRSLIWHWTTRLYDNLWLAGAPAAEGEAVWPDIAPAPGIRRRRC